MKLPEIKALIENYDLEQLRTIIAELYKTISKAHREDGGIDDFY